MFEILKLPENAPAALWICCNPAVMTSSHRHDEVELNLVVSGRAGYICGRQMYEIGSQSLLWLFPDQEHHLLYSSNNFKMWIMVCRRSFLLDLLPEGDVLLERDPPGRFCRILGGSDSTFLNNLAQRIVGDDDMFSLRASLACFLHEARKGYQNAGVGHEYTDLHPAVENLLNILRERGGEGDLEDIGAEAGLSRSHLSRLFHKQTGITIARYRNQIRMENFWGLYGNGERTNILEAALMSGFGSYAQFYRVCRELTGHSPKDIKSGLMNEPRVDI